jgi:DHA2 family multidrug resistance protein
LWLVHVWYQPAAAVSVTWVTPHKRAVARLWRRPDPAARCALAFVLMIPWEMRRRNPAVDVRILATRQFGACFLVMLASGAILLATTQFLPQLVQQDFGYTATWAGLVLSPGGIVTMLMMFVVGRLSTSVQPKYLIVAGAILTALSMYELTSTYGDLGFWFFARTRMVLGVGCH